MSDRIFGKIPGIVEGQTFDNRIELSLSLVHRPRQAGISGSQKEGADSIVLSGGYEDDLDYGDVIVYTGHGGRDISSGKQVIDQDLSKRNLALAISCQQGLPVRVIRGQNHRSVHSPEEGYRYDGLYRIEDYWKEEGKSGFIIWRYRLRKLDFQSNHNYEIQDNKLQEEESDYGRPKRVMTQISRVVRDTFLSKRIKELYEFRCQVCRIRIETSAGYYAEAAHIQPLGTPHNGPDDESNLICLCPNHHVKFDYGGFTILDNLDLLGEDGKLYLHPNHHLDNRFLNYHREHRYDKE